MVHPSFWRHACWTCLWLLLASTCDAYRQDATAEWKNSEFVNRRWDSLMKYCIGNWSGSIGWYTVDRSSLMEPNSNKPNGPSLILRKDSHELNMRMTFHRRQDDDETADWTVCHARHPGSREAVVLTKLPPEQGGDETLLQTLYVFDDGIIGRTGRTFQAFPIIEHGFWEKATTATGISKRRTVVLIYKEKSLERICFLQQHQQDKGEAVFDVADTNPDDIANLPKIDSTNQACWSLQTRQELAQQWCIQKLDLKQTSEVDGLGRKRKNLWQRLGKLGFRRRNLGNDALHRLLGISADHDDDDDESLLRVVLPNGVVVACPLELPAENETAEAPMIISMGYQQSNGHVQVLDLCYDIRKPGLPLLSCHAAYYE